MSGIASAASTMPGSVATFCSCSSERSRRIASRISSSANTRAGTRMSARASAGISYSVSSMRRGSYIEDHARLPASVRPLELKVMVRRGLHDRLHARGSSGQLDPQVRLRQCDRRVVSDEPVGIGEVDQLLEQRDEQRRMVATAELDDARCRLAAAIELD